MEHKKDHQVMSENNNNNNSNKPQDPNPRFASEGCSVLLDVNDDDCWIWAPLNAKAENVEPGKRTRPKVKRHHHFGKSSPPTPQDDLTQATEQQKEVGQTPTTAPNLP
ncbi:unnamed protein product, partial [Brassica oleracea var. botrytis]